MPDFSSYAEALEESLKRIPGIEFIQDHTKKINYCRKTTQAFVCSAADHQEQLFRIDTLGSDLFQLAAKHNAKVSLAKVIRRD